MKVCIVGASGKLGRVLFLAQGRVHGAAALAAAS